jgi:hypothetical protein
MSEPEWQDLQHSDIFEYVSATWFDENNLTGSSQPACVRILICRAELFCAAGREAAVGRIFDPEDHSPRLTLEVLISEGLWKRAFGGGYTNGRNRWTMTGMN